MLFLISNERAAQRWIFLFFFSFTGFDSIGNFENKLKTLYDGVQTFVLFIGYGRSGHTLVGAILDAHPNIIISNELNVLPKWDYYNKKTTVRNRLFFDLHARSRQQAMFGNRAASHKSVSGYTYHVAGQWQGTYKEKIKVRTNLYLRQISYDKHQQQIKGSYEQS